VDDSHSAKPHAPKGRIKARLMDATHLMDTPTGRVQCTAKSKQSGERCRRRPIPGGTVCVIHGGGAPHVKAHADKMLAALERPALARLGQLIDQAEFPTVAMAAVRDALDRIRGRPLERVDANVHQETVFRWATDEDEKA
jgi:hypothetical protein